MERINKDYSKNTIRKIKNSPGPRVLLNVCTHGNERVGLKVMNYFLHYPIAKGTFIIDIANTKAVQARERFLDVDLNRVFPGKKKGLHEERLAYRMRPFIEAFDFVMDVHSTKTGVDSTVILNDFSKEIMPIVKKIAPQRALVMSATKAHSLISSAKLALAFEYGTDTSKKTYTGTVKGVESVLRYFNMIHSVKKGALSLKKVEFYEAFESVPKPEGFFVSKKIKNFKKIEKGDLIGSNPKTGECVYAESDFYPILFGKNTYKTIFGFRARKIK
jgi:predicted deacylase